MIVADFMDLASETITIHFVRCKYHGSCVQVLLLLIYKYILYIILFILNRRELIVVVNIMNNMYTQHLLL